MATGHCLCGQLELSTRGEPGWVSYCHCASCRRHTASPVTCFVNHRLADVKLTGELRRFTSSPGVLRTFCPHCGTPVSYQTERRPDEIDLYVNLFDAPEDFRPQGHAFSAERLPWFDTRDDLPRE